jgi:hypothetical protein
MVYGSIYGASRYGVSEAQFNPDYAMPDGPSLVVEESIKFDQNMFDVIIERDFVECAAMQGAISESTLYAIDESFVSDVWGRVKEFIAKVKEKIVSIAKAAALRVNAFFTKDGSALVEKYGRQFDAADVSKLEIKGWREKKESGSGILASLGNTSELSVVKSYEGAITVSTQKEKDKFEKEHGVDKVLSTYLGGKKTTYATFTKDAESKVFKDPATVKASKIRNTIKDIVSGNGKSINEITEIKDTTEKAYSTAEEDAQKQIDKARSDTYEDDADAGNGGKGKTSQEKHDAAVFQAECAKFVISENSKAVSKVFSTYLDILKLDLKQARKAFITIASKGAGKVTESTLLEAVLDADEYEVDSFFDQYSYDFEELIS